MAMLITTQCPHCHAKFDIPAAQFEDSTAKGRCSHCHNTFFIKDHIVDKQKTAAVTPATSPNLNKAPATSATQSRPQPSTKSSSTAPIAKTDDDLIYDDMEVEEDDDLGDIGDTLIYDDMDINTSRNAASALSDLDLDNLFDDDGQDTASDKRATYDTPISDSAEVSSSSANNIQTNTTSKQRQHTDDNTWLEGLLQEKEPSAPQTNAHNDNTDLSELLSQMGMEADHSAPTQRAPTIHADAPNHSLPIASILWAVGCVVLALLLFAQYLIFNADTIIKNPEQASTLHAICAVASCSLPSADLQQLSIDASLHRPSQVKDPAFFSDIGADIVNQSNTGQLMPSLVIKVYGNSNVLLGDFLAQPEDYLLSPQSQIIANSALPVLFTIPIENQKIAQVAIQPLY